MTTAEKSGRRKKKCIALFNFDDTFSLDSAEDLLRATKTKVDFEISIAKHYFPLCVMPELCKSIIPKLEMDVAVFVINANESCLIINSKKSDRGYTKMYKALLQATGDKVLLVIGGDDNYKSQAERDSNVLSAWAKRIMQSQLDEQFLDGSKSFVFSWDKKHRKIHEQALLHYFDPQNVGLKKFKHVLSQDAKLAAVSNEKTKETEGNSEQNQLGDDAGNDESSGRDKEEDESYNRDNYDMSDVSQHSQTGTFDNGTRKREELSSNKEMPYSALGASAKVQDSHPSGTIFLETHLRYGKISYEAEDVKHWDHKWYPPEIIERSLEREWGATPNATVRFVPDQSGLKLQIINHTSPWLRPLVYIWNLIWNRELEKDGGAP